MTAAAELGAGRSVDDAVRQQVLDGTARLFPGKDDAVEITAIALGPEQHRREDRYHRPLVIRYRERGRDGTLRLWLKFRPDLDRLFPILDACHRRLDPPVFPTPYFAGRCPGEDVAFLATDHVDGDVLRNRLIRLGATRQAGRLVPVFRANGRKMRRFHDASLGGQSIPVDQVVGEANRLIRASRHFTPDERDTVLAHLARCRAALPMTAFPAVTTHNDWVLKNIIVQADGSDLVIDCDSMRHPPNWRWFDVVYLLLNVESQRKWFPLVTAAATEALWRAFWQGYVADGPPEGLTAEQMAAILYIVRIEWLVGGTVRPPYFEIMHRAIDRPFLRTLKNSVLAGRYSLFDFLDVR